MTRVRIGTCSGPAEAALVRAAFEAHDIPVVINAEQHASMLGGLGGALVPLYIDVPEDKAEEAVALLHELRGEDADAEGIAEEPDDPGESMADVAARVQRRRNTGIVVALALCISFGTAHMYTRAWKRGVGLALLELLSFRMMFESRQLGGALLLGCIAIDLVGALVRVRAPVANIPPARVV
jgi:Putative prokaryotic signal transducing protein